MRKKRTCESDEDRKARLKNSAQDRIDQATAGDKVVDAAVRQSIKLHGP